MHKGLQKTPSSGFPRGGMKSWGRRQCLDGAWQ